MSEIKALYEPFSIKKNFLIKAGPSKDQTFYASNALFQRLCFMFTSYTHVYHLFLCNSFENKYVPHSSDQG